MSAKNTPFIKQHEALGAKIVEFAGYNMPIQYTSINEEHKVVRETAGVFDVSHMGEFVFKGEYALDLLQRVSSNDVSTLAIGQIQYGYMPNISGGIIDDMLVYRIEDQVYMMVVNAANLDKDWDWIKSHNTASCDMFNISDNTALLAVQGPKAAEILQSLTDLDLAGMKYYTFKKGVFASCKNVLVSATGYTGAGGFEIYFQKEDADTIWDKMFEVGSSKGLRAIGLAARDTLRLEKGYNLYGNDIDETTSPLEAGLSWVTKFSKEFVNSINLKAEKEAGRKNALVGFKMIDRGIPRHDYELKDKDGNPIGKVTSGTMSPTLKQGIGMGYVKSEFANENSTIFVSVRDKLLEAVVVKLPFVK
ncbi:MAG: glycine cleavage system aminomethyltransferase GcvT [Flavobacteriales bacterium]|nr:glycine cleavage system aminomethyltransferase GcvT [Flavobacteriales bacterium]